MSGHTPTLCTRTSATGRILLLTYISPRERFGAGQRTRLLAHALQHHGAVDILHLRLGRPMWEHGRWSTTTFDGSRLFELCVGRKGIASLPRFDVPSHFVTDTIARHIAFADYDLIVSRYVKPALKVVCPESVPLIVDFDDAVFSPPWRVLTTAKMRLGAVIRLLNDGVIVRMRLRASTRTNARYLFCRQRERERFAWLPGGVLPNVPHAPSAKPIFDIPRTETPTLLFVGLLDYLPNRDGVQWFLDGVWPEVRRALPAARFLIVGQGSPQLLAAWSRRPGVETLGVVESLLEAYSTASAAVVPVRSGGGSNIKTLEAYLYGRMVIGTPAVRDAHGDVFREELDILTASGAKDFAAHCVSALSHPGRSAERARSGHARVATMLTVARFQSIIDASVGMVRPADHATVQPLYRNHDVDGVT